MGSGDVSGTLSQNTTWSGTVAVTGDVTVAQGVTLTISPDTVVNVATGVGITVLGTLDAQGMSGHSIQIIPNSGSQHFGASESGVVVGDGTVAATLTYSYVKQFGAGILVQNGSTATITDTYMAQAAGDFLVTASGAIMTAKYVQIGTNGLTGMTDTTHCDTHFSGGTLTLVHSSLSTSSFGTMFYGGQNAKFMYDNWLNNTTNVDATLGAVTGDFSNGYFAGTQMPSAAGLTANPLATAMLVACDGTNDMSCAGPHQPF
jgi:hypothetical protein